MAPKKFASISGVVYVALGALSLIPALSTRPPDLPPLHLDVSYGLFAGLFAQNIVNKVAIIAFGVAGVLAARSADSLANSILYARAVALVMGLAALLGAIPATSSFFGYWPLWGYEAALHGANALIGAYFGFVWPARATQGRAAQSPA